MEIIKEGPSTSRPLVLDGKNYSSWKPRMIFFIKTLDGRAWRALVAGYEPSMTTVDAKEAWRILEVAFEGTSKVKISRLQLITSKFEALKLSEDETVSEYNERVLEIANESLLLGEKIPDSKIVRKVLRSLPRKFDMKITAIEEAHDITKLKLDELFGSLLTFEMTISHKENKKGKGVAFKSIYEDETTVNQSDKEENVKESIDLLIKQFSNVVEKFKNLNTTGSNAQNLINYQRKDGKNNTRRFNENSNRRSSDYGRKKGANEEFLDVENVMELDIIRLNVPHF
ncbi:gag-pol polyprotein [Cucumis melo var. makuwa]|uniref:Gag-pol polyprotein n=1 Tax=Cucumis melo var. makuwa TaxID=1194695 RepID=A0A5D3DEG1_CUCMM|nr:gag-pol polyprotein [Cucumis melo var. makuwa]TYK21974.1 gag-pol polyprotein [Cucumis melo var. makuwa]